MKPKVEFNINWQHILKETPQILRHEIDPNYITKQLYTPVEKAIAEGKYCATDDSEIFYIPKLFGGIFFYYKDKKIIGVVDFDLHNYNKESMLTPILAKKFERDFPNILHRIYKAASKQINAKIVSGYMQTTSTVSIWKKFWNNPEKYGIKEIYTIPQGLTNEDDIWGGDKKFREVRIVIKF